MARPRKRIENIKYTVRVTTETDKSLRLLYAIDKRVKGQMTFNDYMEQEVFGKFITSREKDISIVRSAMSKLVSNEVS